MADLAGGIEGRRIDRYVIEDKLGSGGFGTVYRAKHTVLGTTVALKVLSPQHSSNAEVVQRFLREAKSAAAIGSPHIVAVYDAGLSDTGLPFLAMELLDGEDLEQRLDRTKTLTVEIALEVCIQILEGLGVAHERGIVHRDMKPANVFLSNARGGFPFVKLLDFGISKMVQSSEKLTQTGAMLGTPAYMAPEQLQDTRSVDHRADLYAVAVILFESLTGALPHQMESFADIIARVAGAESPRLEQFVSGAPQGLGDLIARGMATRPEDRFQNAEEMSRALAAVRATGPMPTTLAKIASEVPSKTPVLGGYKPIGSAAPIPSTNVSDAPTTGPMGGGAYTPQVSGYPGASTYVTPPAGGHPAPYGGPSSHPPAWNTPSGPFAPNAYGGMHSPSPMHSPAPMHAPSMGAYAPAARQERSGSTGLYLAIGALAIGLPLACIGGGVLAYGVADQDDDPTPTVEPNEQPRSIPPVVDQRPSTRTVPDIPPPPPMNPLEPRQEPQQPTVIVIPPGTDPCTVPVSHDAICDRTWDHFEPAPCRIQNGRELHLVGAYTPQNGDGTIVVDITRTAAPIVLALNSYSAATWEIRAAEGVNIERVILSGYNRSEVTGLGPSVEIDHREGTGGQYPPMAWSWDGFTDQWSGQVFSNASEQHTNLVTRSFVGCYSPTRFTIGQRPPQ